MCNKCVLETECACLKEAMGNAKSSEGMAFIREFLANQRKSRGRIAEHR